LRYVNVWNKEIRRRERTGSFQRLLLAPSFILLYIPLEHCIFVASLLEQDREKRDVVLLHSGWAVDQAILCEEERLVVIRFGHDWDDTCMQVPLSPHISTFQLYFLLIFYFGGSN
jgi:hypothetical protein